MQIAKKLEISVEVNTPASKANYSEIDYLSQDSPFDLEFNQASDLSDYMGVQDADFVQFTLECNKAINEGTPRPQQRTWRGPVREDLKIEEAWGEMKKELKQA